VVDVLDRDPVHLAQIDLRVNVAVNFANKSAAVFE
jgi:hypothetical protein